MRPERDTREKVNGDGRLIVVRCARQANEIASILHCLRQASHG